MILKTALAFSFVAATPLVLVPSAAEQQDPHRRQTPTTQAESAPTRSEAEPPAAPATRSDHTELQRLRGEVERLRKQVEHERKRAQDEQERAAEAEGEISTTLDELREALDLLTSEEARERDCAPSRHLINRHEWLKRRGHEKHAERVVERISKTYRNDRGRLNRLAWNLMTEQSSLGKYDLTALAITNRMEEMSRGKDIPHQQLDTIAFANFLNGKIARAVTLERQALQGDDRSDYRRRLRTYEAAHLAMQDAARQHQIAQAKAQAAANDSAASIARLSSDDALVKVEVVAEVEAAGDDEE